MDDECSRGRRSEGPGSGSPARRGQALCPGRFYRTDGLLRGQGGGIATPEGGTSQRDGGAERKAHPQLAVIFPCLGLEGFEKARPCGWESPSGASWKGVEGEKGKEGAAASHVGFALWWSCRSVMGSKWGLSGAIGLSGGIRGRCRIGFVGFVWGFYGFWAIFVVKSPSFCDNSSKFGCFLRFSGFSMPFSVFLGVSVALVSAVGGVAGPVPGSPSSRFPARRKAAWGPPPGAWPSFLHQMGTP